MTRNFFNNDQKERIIDICAIENALFDHLVRATDAEFQKLNLTKGVMQLVSSETQKELLTNLNARSIETELGGSAANTIKGASMLGAKTVYSSKVGNDIYGINFTKRLIELGITERLAISNETQTGTCVVVVTPDGERTMNTNLGACREYQKSELPENDIRKSKILFTTGYMWDTENQIEAIEHAIAFAKECNTKIALDVADPFAVNRSREVFWKHLNSKNIDILFANAEEAHMLIESRGAEAAKKLAEYVEIAVVKDGANGAFISYQGKVSHLPAIPTAVVDTTGAGDMFAGGFLFALTKELSIEMCGCIGSILASDTISYLGVRLSSDIFNKINDLIK